MTKPTMLHVLSVTALVVSLFAFARNGADPVHANMLMGSISQQAALGTSFTYQGYLTRNGKPVNGQDLCDMRFSLWNAASGGGQLGSVQTISGVDFIGGSFTVTLNESGQFGANAFSGEARWLQVDFACPSGSTTYTTIGRQAITAVPYALHSTSTGALQGRPVSAAAPTNGQVLAWNGTAWSPATGYARTLIVSPRGAATESGTALLAALASITDASAEKPYLLKIEPGVYDFGTDGLRMKPYVDVEGSGEGTTRLRGTGGPGEGNAVVFGSNNADLRFLSVEAQGGDALHTTAILNNGVSPRFLHLNVSASRNPSNFGQGDSYVYAVRNQNRASPLLQHVTIRSANGRSTAGVFNLFNSSPTLQDVTIEMGGGNTNTGGAIQTIGVYSNEGGSPTLINTTITNPPAIESDYGIFSGGSTETRVHSSRINSSLALQTEANGIIRVGASQVGGSVSGSVSCAASYTRSFVPLTPQCGLMP